MVSGPPIARAGVLGISAYPEPWRSIACPTIPGACPPPTNVPLLLPAAMSLTIVSVSSPGHQATIPGGGGSHAPASGAEATPRAPEPVAVGSIVGGCSGSAWPQLLTNQSRLAMLRHDATRPGRSRTALT